MRFIVLVCIFLTGCHANCIKREAELRSMTQTAVEYYNECADDYNDLLDGCEVLAEAYNQCENREAF